MHPVLAAIFITPAFLWAGLSLISIPIIIHILNRRRFKIVTWAAMEYLLQALRKNRRRVKFEQFLLLLTRCAILTLLGLALARPLGCTDSTLAALAGGKSGLHVFIIDNSYSMAYEADRPAEGGRPGAATHFEQARNLARQQIDRLSSGGEAVAIVSAARPKMNDDGSPGSQLVLRPSYDLVAARGAVDRMEQSFLGTDIRGALEQAVQIARDEQRQPQKFLYILTDCTQGSWETRQSEDLKNIGKDLATLFGNRIRMNDVSRAGQWNYAVLDLKADSGLVTRNFHTDFFMNAKGYGPGPDPQVQWKWDSTPQGDPATTPLNPNSEPLRQEKIVIKEGGPHLLTAEIIDGTGKLKRDNIRDRVVMVASELKTLIVEGERGNGQLSGSGAFLDVALAPVKTDKDGNVRSDSYVSPERITDLEFSNKVLTDYRAIILTNVASLNEQQATQLQKFVEQGGTLLTFMGEQVNTDAYNSILYPKQLMPGKLIARKTAAEGKIYHLDFRPNAPLHPILFLFRGVEGTGLDTASVNTYFQMEIPPKSQVETVLKYGETDKDSTAARDITASKETNDPAITVHNLGKGRVATITTTANSDWNNLPGKGAYVALVHELIAGTVNVGDGWMNLEVGHSVEVPAGLKLLSIPTLVGPDNKPILIELYKPKQGPDYYRSRPLEKPGVYHLETGGGTRLPIAVNIPADEADIRQLPHAAVKKALGDIDMQIYGDTIPVTALTRDDATDLGWTVMLLVLALVGAECFMAMTFGHYRRSPGAAAVAA